MPTIYMGHPKDGESESAELRSLGLKYNKSEPSRIGLIGLRTLEQPGYESYTHHIAGFMFANDTKEKQSLHRVGFPIRFPISQCFPLLCPPLHLKVKTNEIEGIRKLLNNSGVEFTETKQKAGNTEAIVVTASNAVPALSALRSISFMRTHAPAGQVSFNGLLAYLLAARIFSSFFKTHTYPAFTAPSEEEDYDGLKRRIEETETNRKKIRLDRQGTGGVPLKDTGMDIDTSPETSNEEDKVVLRFAKPSDDTVTPWGLNLGDIPSSYGIVFPFVPQLANWDKDMIPSVMERYFIRCFGSNDTALSEAFSGFVASWRSEVYSTYSGIVLSHMAKVISIALPAQARPFPVFEEGQYRGCYLVGANFSVALKATLIRPDTFKSNQDDLRLLFGKERFLDWVLKNFLKEQDQEPFGKMSFDSLRTVHNWLIDEGYSAENDTQLFQIRAMAANANFPIRYLPVTVDNVQDALINSLEGVSDSTQPMHYEGFMSLDPFEVNLSAFGPGVPSPHIPGAKEITSFKAVPAQSTACFRRCQLRSAVSEWRDVLEKGVVRNEPRSLNARFQFVKISGVEEKAKWYSMLDKLISIGKENLRKVEGRSGAETLLKKGDSVAFMDSLFDE